MSFEEYIFRLHIMVFFPRYVSLEIDSMYLIYLDRTSIDMFWIPMVELCNLVIKLESSHWLVSFVQCLASLFHLQSTKK